MRNALLLFFGLLFITAFAQKDTITFKNKDIIVGELKEMTSNILIVKTPYSDSDFNITFDKVESLNLEHRYSVALSNGQRVYGTIQTVPPDNTIKITQEDGTTVMVQMNQIVTLKKVEAGFWNHFKGTIDFGYVITRSNNSQQLNFAGALNYISEKWIHRAQYNQLYTTQDDVDDIKRVDWSVDSKRYLAHNWFLSSNLSFLSNTSQELDAKITPSIGAGNYLVRNNKLFFLVGTGITYNIEKYYNSADDKESTEMQIITQFNMFNFKNIDLYASAIGYPSLSEKGRFRADYSFKIKYDLPFDFYIKTELQANFDNQPVASAIKNDYVFSTGFGWELK
ncbi:DUF481 domain-containing protein [Flavobacterium adhaerens]|uniref:DUF481 domain-containing protein n=1 Tax=Flavobacterium adhaerens TaxID=3149043 RepID=UPI0032B32F78